MGRYPRIPNILYGRIERDGGFGGCDTRVVHVDSISRHYQRELQGEIDGSISACDIGGLQRDLPAIFLVENVVGKLSSQIVPVDVYFLLLRGQRYEAVGDFETTNREVNHGLERRCVGSRLCGVARNVGMAIGIYKHVRLRTIDA